jgi:acetyl esterase/lipase
LCSSGFIIPSLGTNREFCSLIAARTRCLVFDVDYRKAPEHPFPAAIQDAEDIAHYLAANQGQYDASNIFLSGFSAGGNIALVTASTLGPERVKGVIVLYAPIDFTKPHIAPEKRILAGFIIPPFVRSIFDGSYMLPSQPRTDPRVSPILGPTENVPNHVYLACGNADSLYDPAVEFVERLKDAGHQDAEFVGLDCMAHAFDMLAKEGTEAEEKKNKVYGDAVDLINRAIGARG